MQHYLAGEDGTSAFCNSVNDGQLRQLSTLIISRNEISDAGTIHLAQSISAMVLPSLTAIDVSSNSVGEGLISLVGALTNKLPGFKELDISLNEIEDATAEVLLDALTSNQLPSIQVLGLELNGLSPQMELRCSGIIHCSPADIEAEATNNCQCLPVDPHLTRAKCSHCKGSFAAMLTRAHEKLPLPRKPNAFVTDGLRQPVLSVDPSDLHLVVQPSHFDTEMDYGQWTKPTDYDKVIDEDEVLDEQLRVYAAREKRFGSSTMRMSNEKCRSRRRELAIATQERQDKKNVDRCIAGCQESKLSRWIRTSPSCVVAQPLRQNCFVTLLLGELTQD